MSGVTAACPVCGVPVTVMCGSLPGLCNKCYWERNPETIVRPPGSISPDGRDFEVWYVAIEGGHWILDYMFRYQDQAEGRARYLLGLYPSVKICQIIDYHSHA